MALIDFIRSWGKAPAPPAEQPPPPKAALPIGFRPAPLATDPNKSGGVTGQYLGIMPNESPTLRYQSGKAGSGFRTNYGLLREIPAKDGRISGMIDQRKSGALRREMYWADADTSAKAQFCSEFMRQVDRGIEKHSAQMGGLVTDMYQALDAPLYGIYVGKLTWDWREIAVMTNDRERRRSKRYLVPVDIAQEDIDRVKFDWGGRLCIYAKFQSDADAAAHGFTKVPNESHWWYPHPMSYVVFNPYSQADGPYGRAILETVFYCAWAKRMVRVFHMNFIERNTSPLAVAEQAPNSFGITGEQRTAVETALDNIQQETGLTMPPGLTFKWAELMSNASAQAIQDFEKFCDYEAASAILGQSSTSMTERSGSMSSAEVQERVADSIVAMDSLLLQGFRNQIMRLTLAYNLPDMEHWWPRFTVQIDNAQDLEKWMTTTKVAVELGLDVPQRQVYRKLGIDEPRPGEPVLEIMPAAYAQPGAGAPSQQRGAKTQQKRTERERQRPAQSQAQPRRGQR